MIALLLISILLLAYTWAVYPWLLAWAARGAYRCPVEAADPPPSSVAVILAAHNEERCIAERIRNLQAVDTGGRTLAVYVGVDASTDATVRCACEAAAGDPRIHVRAFTERRGKVGILKTLVDELAPADGGALKPPPDLLLFTDANTEFAPDAVVRLLRHFHDPRVGGACGRLILGGRSRSGVSPEGAYWRWENQLKERESRVDSCLGANGALYAIRRELFWNAIPANTIIDDFVIGMKVREQGFRMVYEPEALAFEDLPDVKDEWRRRIRIGAGDFQALALCRRCLRPRYGAFAGMFWSHKVLRWLTPHLMLAAMLSAGFLVWRAWTPVPDALFDVPRRLIDLHSLRLGRDLGAFFSVAVALASVVLLPCVLVGRWVRGGSRLARLCRLVHHFVAMQAALFVGFLRFCRGGLGGAWERTARR